MLNSDLFSLSLSSTGARPAYGNYEIRDTGHVAPEPLSCRIASLGVLGRKEIGKSRGWCIVSMIMVPSPPLGQINDGVETFPTGCSRRIDETRRNDWWGFVEGRRNRLAIHRFGIGVWWHGSTADNAHASSMTHHRSPPVLHSFPLFLLFQQILFFLFFFFYVERWRFDSADLNDARESRFAFRTGIRGWNLCFFFFYVIRGYSILFNRTARKLLKLEEYYYSIALIYIYQSSSQFRSNGVFLPP